MPCAAMCPHRAAPSPANTGCAAARHHPNPHMLSQPIHPSLWAAVWRSRAAYSTSALTSGSMVSMNSSS